MKTGLKQKIRALEDDLFTKGIGKRSRIYLLLTPSEALIFLDEVSKMNIDLAILGTTLWKCNEEGHYYETIDIINFDKIPRDKNFFDYSHLETRKHIESLKDDPMIDRLVIDFESDAYREKRLNQININQIPE